MKKRRAFLTLVVLGAFGAGGWYAWTNGYLAGMLPQGGSGTQARGGGGRRGSPLAGGNEAIPVLVSPVRVVDVPVTRDGIGNVQAFAIVTIRAQVDGRLIEVSFREGQPVKKGDVLARIDPAVYQSQYDQAVAKRAQDAANLANLRVDLERYDKLAATNAGSKQQADAQRAMVAQFEALTRSDDAAIDNARAVLGYTTIASPIDGVAGLRQVDVGNIIHSSDAAGLVTVAQIKPISAVFTLPQRDLGLVAASLARGTVSADAIEADGSVLASGTLQVIDNQVDTTTGTVKLKAQFANDEQKLWPGQFVTVRLRVDTLKQATVVPTPAIRRGPNGTFVYLLDGDVVRVRPVEVAQQDERDAVIRSGVAAGDRIVTTGFMRLAEGKRVIVGAEEGAAPVAAPPPRQRPQNGERRRRNGDGAAPEAGTPGRRSPPPGQPAAEREKG